MRTRPLKHACRSGLELVRPVIDCPTKWSRRKMKARNFYLGELNQTVDMLQAKITQRVIAGQLGHLPALSRTGAWWDKLTAVGSVADCPTRAFAHHLARGRNRIEMAARKSGQLVNNLAKLLTRKGYPILQPGA